MNVTNSTFETVQNYREKESFCFPVLSGIWYLAGNMTSARDFHKSIFITTTRIVQIVGGSDGSSDLSSTEIFVVRNGSFVQQGSTSAMRRFHTVDCLNDRTVLIAGGWHSVWTAELYDPLVGVSNASIRLNTPRAEHASAVINDSLNGTTKLLLVGGMDGTGKLASGDVFDTSTGVFTLVDNNMTSSRYYHTATAVDGGHVLLAGGINNDTVKLDSLELYNCSSNLFVPISARLSTARAYHTATYIPSIQAVLFVGGRSQTQALRTYDLFNVSTLTFSILNGSTLNARAYHTATLLLDEQVLIVGGQNSVRLSSCELYNPVTNSFESVSDMSTDRGDHTSTLLPHTGHVLTCGGQNENGMVLSSCELYRP